MKLSKERVMALSVLLVDQLTASGMIEPVGDRKALALSLDRIVTDELSVEDRLNAQAKALMQKYDAEIAKGRLDEQELFTRIKKQLAKEQGAII